jgi:uncharacterized membrane protein YkvA (DUF1232 family)
MNLVLICLAATLGVYATVVLAFMALGRRTDARLIARFIPDCLVFFRRLFADERVSHSRKIALLFALAYLASPIDLIPDFIPVAGQLDDAVVVALVLRFVLRSGGPGSVDGLWPGPPRGAALIKRLAFGSQRNASLASRMP